MSQKNAKKQNTQLKKNRRSQGEKKEQYDEEYLDQLQYISPIKETNFFIKEECYQDLPQDIVIKEQEDISLLSQQNLFNFDMLYQQSFQINGWALDSLPFERQKNTNIPNQIPPILVSPSEYKKYQKRDQLQIKPIRYIHMNKKTLQTVNPSSTADLFHESPQKSSEALEYYQKTQLNFADKNYIEELIHNFKQIAQSNAKKNISLLEQVFMCPQKNHMEDEKNLDGGNRKRSNGFVREITKQIISILLRMDCGIRSKDLHQLLLASLRKNVCFSVSKHKNMRKSLTKRIYDIINVLKSVELMQPSGQGPLKKYKKYCLLNPKISYAKRINLKENSVFHKIQQIERRKQILRQMKEVKNYSIIKQVRQKHQIHPLIKINVQKVSKQELQTKLAEGLMDQEIFMTQAVKNQPIMIDRDGKKMGKKRGRKRKHELIDLPNFHKIAKRYSYRKKKRQIDYAIREQVREEQKMNEQMNKKKENKDIMEIQERQISYSTTLLTPKCEYIFYDDSEQNFMGQRPNDLFLFEQRSKETETNKSKSII